MVYSPPIRRKTFFHNAALVLFSHPQNQILLPFVLLLLLLPLLPLLLNSYRQPLVPVLLLVQRKLFFECIVFDDIVGLSEIDVIVISGFVAGLAFFLG